MKNTITSAILALVFAVTALFGVGSVAFAGTYWTTQVCNHSTSKYVCFDKSQGTVTIKDGSSVTAYPASAAFSPSKGYIAYDVYDCNAAAPSFDTAFTTAGSYGIPTSVQYVVDNGGAPAPGNIYVSQSVHDTIAWVANSQSGYACFVTP
jgi:hypothetical protein